MPLLNNLVTIKFTISSRAFTNYSINLSIVVSLTWLMLLMENCVLPGNGLQGNIGVTRLTRKYKILMCIYFKLLFIGLFQICI